MIEFEPKVEVWIPLAKRSPSPYEWKSSSSRQEEMAARIAAAREWCDQNGVNHILSAHGYGLRIGFYDEEQAAHFKLWASWTEKEDLDGE